MPIIQVNLQIYKFTSKLIIISDRYGGYTVKIDNKDFLNYLLNISYSFNILTSF